MYTNLPFQDGDLYPPFIVEYSLNPDVLGFPADRNPDNFDHTDYTGNGKLNKKYQLALK